MNSNEKITLKTLEENLYNLARFIPFMEKFYANLNSIQSFLDTNRLKDERIAELKQKLERLKESRKEMEKQIFENE